jgi:hypothetical protein
MKGNYLRGTGLMVYREVWAERAQGTLVIPCCAVVGMHKEQERCEREDKNEYEGQGGKRHSVFSHWRYRRLAGKWFLR